MKNKKNLIGIALLGVLNLQGQETTLSSGGNALGTNGNISYSVGQMVYTTNFGATGSVAQGVQQSTSSSLITYYADADGDGYGNPALSINATTPPPGYVAIGTDCNDANAAVHPGAIDVCLDGIDNDCNGIIDNVGQAGGCIPTLATLQSAQCGTTISNLATTITASYIVGAQGYRFKITNLLTNAVALVDRPVNSFALSSLPGITLATPYQIEVALKINNVWQPFYGAPCFLSTPNPVATIGNQCGSTLTAMNQWISSTYVSNVSAYKFRITRVVGGVPVGTSQEIVNLGLNKFNMSQLSGILYSSTYRVEVSLRNTDGTFLPYNTPCDITTPAYPTTQIRLAQCNNYQATSNSELIFADAVSGAIQYRFRLFNGGYDTFYDTSYNRFTLNNFSGLIADATIYSVQVAVKMPNEPNFGPYNAICSIRTPLQAKVVNFTKPYEAITVFNIVVYPNPFTENFMLDIQTASEEMIQVRVYDMMGKLIENKTMTVSEITAQKIGADLPSGVYNVIVNQGERCQTLRSIKK